MTDTPLEDEIRARIARKGPLRFRDFMALALYDPRHGYYAAGRAAIGWGGDFFTSVSVGKMFGELLGWQFREMWERLGRGTFTVVEQGAHDGMFAADVLGWAREAAPEFARALRYEIVEGFAPLRERQQARLGEFGVTWRGSVEELPEFNGVHFSNELVDAFPVHLVRYTGGEWHERHVCAGATGFEWLDLPVRDAALEERLGEIPRIEGYTTEVNLEAGEWAAGVAARLRRGWVLAIDYGFPRRRYYDPARTAGTLQAYAGHARNLDPLLHPGRADLTAHVDFTSLAEAFRAHGLVTGGYTDQHHFLVGLSALAFADRAPGAREARELKTLLHPEMLGSSFQALLMARGVEGTLSGFRFARDAEGELRG